MKLLLLLVMIGAFCLLPAHASGLAGWQALCRPEGLPVEKGPSGVPMGGIGCGYLEFGPEGFLVCNCMNNIHESYITLMPALALPA